jgi:hypothetical protein
MDEVSRPSTVFGPVDFLAFFRLAAIWALLAITITRAQRAHNALCAFESP